MKYFSNKVLDKKIKEEGGGGDYTAGEGIDISENEISIDSDTRYDIAAGAEARSYFDSSGILSTSRDPFWQIGGTSGLVELKSAYSYVGAKKGIIFSVNQNEDANAHLEVVYKTMAGASDPIPVLHSKLPFYSDSFVSAGGLSSGGGGGGGGGATSLEGLDDVEYTGTPVAGQALVYVIRDGVGLWTNATPTGGGTVTTVANVPPTSGGDIPKAELSAALGTGTVTQGNSQLVTGGTVYSAINSAISSVLKFEGVSSTPITDGGTQTPTIGGVQVTPYKGMVVLYGSKEFVWSGSAWEELGDEASWALKTITITGTGYLTGGGSLEANRTIDIAEAVKTKIEHGESAYNRTDWDQYLGIDANGHIYVKDNRGFYSSSFVSAGGVGSGGGGGGGATELADLEDINFVTPITGGQVLMYRDLGSGDGEWYNANIEVGGVKTVANVVPTSGGNIPLADLASAFTTGGYKLTDHEYTNGTGLSLSNGTFSLTQAVQTSLGKADTAIQTVYDLVINNSAGTTQLTYKPATSGTYSITLTKAMVGLGDVENTKLSTWAGSGNITTVGTISNGTWQGDPIGYNYVAAHYIGGTRTASAAGQTTLLGIDAISNAQSSGSSDLSRIVWDSDHDAWHFLGNLYADGFVSAGGMSDSGGGGGASNLYDLLDMSSTISDKPSGAGQKIIVFNPNGTDKQNRSGAWEYANMPSGSVTSVVGQTGDVTAAQISTAIGLGNYLPLAGGTMTGAIKMNYVYQSGANFRFIDNRAVSGGSGWADNVFGIYNAAESSLASIGIYGSADALTYLYIGSNGYSGVNLRINSSSIKWGDDDIYHSGNFVANTNYITPTTANGRYAYKYTSRAHGDGSTAYTGPTFISTFVGENAIIDRGSWAYANNGYIDTGVGKIDLAGTMVVAVNAGATGSAIFITPSTSNKSGAVNEMFFFTQNGNGSSYPDAWTRVMTNRNFTSVIGSTTYAPYIEAGYVSKAGDTITSTGTVPLTLNSTYSSGQSVIIYQSSGTNKSQVGYGNATYGTWMYDYGTAAYINIPPSATTLYWKNSNPFFHSGNADKSDVAWTCSILTARDYVLFRNTDNTANAGYVGRGSSARNDIQLVAYAGGKLELAANNVTTITIDNSTSPNVGIGTTAPSYKLEVAGTIASVTSSGGFVRIGYPNTANANAGTIEFKNGTYNGCRISSVFAASWARQNLVFYSSSDTSGSSNWNAAMTIQYDGNVGIGTTSPGVMLDVNGPSRSKYHYFYSTYSSSAVGYIGCGSGSSDNIYLSANSGVNVLISPTGGNVGIGTASPSYKFHVNITEIGWASVIDGPNTQVALCHGGGYGIFAGSKQSSSSYYLLDLRYGQTTPGSGGTSALYVRTDGNVGVGTNAPAYKLDVAGVARCIYMHFKDTAGTGDAGYIGRGSSANNNLQFTAASGNGLGLGANGSDNVLFINTSSNVGIGNTAPGYPLHVNGTIASINANGGSIRLGTANNSNTSAGEIFFQNGTRNGFKIAAVYAGYAARQNLVFYRSNITADPYAWTPVEIFKLSYDGVATVTGTFVSTGDQVISSDINLKENLAPVTYTIEDIAKTRAVTFDWKDGRGKSAGSIAQDWKPLIPELVHGEEGNMTLAYGQIALVNTILLAKHETEQDKEIKKLKARVKELEKQLEIRS